MPRPGPLSFAKPHKEFEPKAFRTGCDRDDPAQAEEAGPLVSVAGLREMMLSERTAEVELTDGRETRWAVNIKTPIAFIQAHKFGGVQSTGRCACDRLLLISAVGHGDGQD
jgi:hypothetical protein